MNYISHIHLAHRSDTSLLGNFLGDFVKGKLENDDELPISSEILNGIKLHRRIDSFTDSHPLIVELRHLFPSGLRRMAGVVIDIYFDHVLCCSWLTYTQQSIEVVLDNFYREMDTDMAKIIAEHLAINQSSHFTKVRENLLARKWLADYMHEDSCLRAFYQIEKRLRHKIQFAESAYTFVQHERSTLKRVFHEFYPQLINFAKNNV